MSDEPTVGHTYRCKSDEAQLLERVIHERDRLYEERWVAQQRELALAQKEMERRLEGLNELRAQVLEDRGRFVTRELFDAEMDARGARLALIEKWQAAHAELGAHPAALKELSGLTERLMKVEESSVSHTGSTGTLRWIVPVFVSATALVVALAGLLHSLS